MAKADCWTTTDDEDVYKRQVLAPTPDKITALGMARTFQNIRLWKTQTVFDNVLIAKHMRRTSNLFTAAFHLNAKDKASCDSVGTFWIHSQGL